jgi:hypothetical protein
MGLSYASDACNCSLSDGPVASFLIDTAGDYHGGCLLRYSSQRGEWIVFGLEHIACPTCSYCYASDLPLARGREEDSCASCTGSWLVLLKGEDCADVKLMSRYTLRLGSWPR